MSDMTIRPLVAATLATALFAACGGEKPAASGATGETAAKKAMLAYAKCMRAHGIDMPDPQFDGNRTMQRGPKSVNRAKMRTADQACASIRDAVKPPELSAAKQAEFKKAALKNAQCMRDHGINFPDPTFDKSGGASIEMKRGSGLNPDSPKFKVAEKACRDTLPDVEDDG
jgi:hypothetical protein